VINLEHIDNGNTFEFGQISNDYAKYRDIYPDVLFRQSKTLDCAQKGKWYLI
jgi:hypothetical protein